MRKVFIILLMGVVLPATATAQSAECTSTHGYTDGKHKGATQKKPSTATLGFTRSATGCLDLCMQKRTHYAQEGKVLFGKMQYSCHYNGKMLNTTTQILH